MHCPTRIEWASPWPVEPRSMNHTNAESSPHYSTVVVVHVNARARVRLHEIRRWRRTRPSGRRRMGSSERARTSSGARRSRRRRPRARSHSLCGGAAPLERGSGGAPTAEPPRTPACRPACSPERPNPSGGSEILYYACEESKPRRGLRDPHS